MRETEQAEKGRINIITRRATGNLIKFRVGASGNWHEVRLFGVDMRTKTYRNLFINLRRPLEHCNINFASNRARVHCLPSRQIDSAFMCVACHKILSRSQSPFATPLTRESAHRHEHTINSICHQGLRRNLAVFTL